MVAGKDQPHDPTWFTIAPSPQLLAGDEHAVEVVEAGLERVLKA
jgi:hypothetical protein